MRSSKKDTILRLLADGWSIQAIMAETGATRTYIDTVRWQQANPEKLAEHNRKYKMQTREKRAEYNRNYYKQNREKIVAARRRRRAEDV